MKLINSNFEILEQEPGINGLYKIIECAGRTCYHSQDKITEDSAKKFVNMLIKSGHGAMLEHGTVYLSVPLRTFTMDYPYGTNWKTLSDNKYTKVVYDSDCVYITTNMRVIIENDLQGVLEHICCPNKYHAKRIIVKWYIDRVTGESFLRHRVFSFARESTRYCNFSKNKFGNNVTCIIPSWCNLREGYYGYQMSTDAYISEGNPTIDEGYLYSKKEIKTKEDADKAKFINDENTPLIRSLTTSESCYFSLLDQGWTAQQARQVLPFALYSPLIMTGFAEDWVKFFYLRNDKSAHPDAYKLAHSLHDEFIKRGYITETQEEEFRKYMDSIKLNYILK